VKFSANRQPDDGTTEDDTADGDEIDDTIELDGQSIQVRNVSPEEARRLVALVDPGTTNHRTRALSDEAARWRTKYREAEGRIRELEAGNGNGSEALRRSRLETAFLRTAYDRDEPIADLETAWDLANAKGYLDPVKIADDGTVQGMMEALNRLVGRYPYLADVADVDDESDPPTNASGRPMNRRRPAPGVPTRAGLQERFPALRRGGR
jgi:hypothetical protein